METTVVESYPYASNPFDLMRISRDWRDDSNGVRCAEFCVSSFDHASGQWVMEEGHTHGVSMWDATEFTVTRRTYVGDDSRATYAFDSLHGYR